MKRVKRRRLLFCVLAGILLCLSAVSFCMAKSGKADGGNELLVTFKTGVTKRQDVYKRQVFVVRVFRDVVFVA